MDNDLSNSHQLTTEAKSLLHKLSMFYPTRSPRSHGLVVREVTRGARVPGFNASSSQELFLSLGKRWQDKMRACLFMYSTVHLTPCRGREGGEEKCQGVHLSSDDTTRLTYKMYKAHGLYG